MGNNADWDNDEVDDDDDNENIIRYESIDDIPGHPAIKEFFKAMEK